MDKIIAENLLIISKKIADAEREYHRQPRSVSLLAASKGQSIAKILAAYEVGQRIFGENYLQEALTKQAALSNKPDIEWHYIGTLQRNKTRKIAEHFAWVHTISDLRIAERLNDQRPPDLPALNICIEVNVDNEASKSGIRIADVSTLAQACQQLSRLHLRGFMCIPAIHTDFAAQRYSFRKVAETMQTLNKQGFALDTLSMGMSNDFEAAIAEGATIVRIGTSLFGKRIQ